jgi:hypothetical protein
MFAEQPVDRLRSFAYEYRDIADTLHSRITNGENVTLQFKVTLEISPEASAEFSEAVRRFGQTATA